MLFTIPKEMKDELIEAFGTEELAKTVILTEKLNENEKLKEIYGKYKDQLNWE